MFCYIKKVHIACSILIYNDMRVRCFQLMLLIMHEMESFIFDYFILLFFPHFCANIEELPFNL